MSRTKIDRSFYGEQFERESFLGIRFLGISQDGWPIRSSSYKRKALTVLSTLIWLSCLCALIQWRPGLICNVDSSSLSFSNGTFSLDIVLSVIRKGLNVEEKYALTYVGDCCIVMSSLVVGILHRSRDTLLNNCTAEVDEYSFAPAVNVDTSPISESEYGLENSRLA